MTTRMRFLNKIVFINSAHIRYAEIALDGNVHFSGTQGVGKTTVLRALLFFYNADKEKVGLRKQNQQSFDDYYVPTRASYIIYEVTRGDEERPFSVILFRHHNRSAFRFVDAPYCKEWFVDSMGSVASDPVTIRQRIQQQGIDLSNIVDRYTHYLDIIYGNRSAKLTKDLLKYYLLKSQQYQNIRRIIQNVFLNDRVDADFIKNTIISSISGEEEQLAIDLNFFRSKLVNFSDELKDISLWTAKNRHGIVETKRDADLIIATARGIKASEHSIFTHCGMLNFARYRVEKDIPLLRSRIAKIREAIDKLEGKLSGLKSKFDADHDKYLKALGALSEKLREAASLRKRYRQMGIDEMIARVANLEALRLDLRQKERLLEQSRSQYESISKRFEAITERLNVDKETYVQARKEQHNAATADFNGRESLRLAKQAKLEADIRAQSKVLTDEIEQNIASNREMLHEQEMLRLEASKSSPMKRETDDCLKSISELEKEVNELSHRRLENDNRLESLRNQLESECRRLEADFALKEIEIRSRINTLKAEHASESSLLEKFRGSLCEWLDRNIDSWELTIGKVIDEKEVLYSRNLNPAISNNGEDSIFGVKLDLGAICREVRTPSMIEEHIGSLEADMEKLSAEINRLREQMNLDIEECGKRLKPMQKAIQNDNDRILHQQQVCSRQIKTERLRLEDIKSSEAARLKEIDDAYATKIEELKLTAAALRDSLQKTKGKFDRELKNSSKIREADSRKDRQNLEALLKSIDDDVEAYVTEYRTKLDGIRKEERAALSGSGADMGMLDTLTDDITRMRLTIESVEKERMEVAIYRKDCERLLDHEPEFQTEKKTLEEKDAALKQKYEGENRKLRLKITEGEKLLSESQTALEKATEAICRTDDFIASSACPQAQKEAGVIDTGLDCLTIIDTIKNMEGEVYRLSDKLKRLVNEFHKRFSAANTFKFPLEFDSTDGYLRYAESLEEFVGNDKIKEFQQVTSNLYRDILSRAAADFNMLLGSESEIRRIVIELNHDFSRKTFAGVIRNIMLQLDRSTMPVIIQLQNITDFWNANQYELGELNLFSDDNHDDINREAIKYLKSLTEVLTLSPELKKLSLGQTFSLKIKVEENDNATDWMENLKTVGSEGTDILVKAIINILLVSVFKKRAGNAGDFRLHCMMDEIGRLADDNIRGILNFANERGIFIVNSSPKAQRPLSYRHLYMLAKDSGANTTVTPILSTRQANML